MEEIEEMEEIKPIEMKIDIENKRIPFHKVLPPVITRYIFSFLTLKDLCRVSRVSKEINGEESKKFQFQSLIF